MGFIAHDVGQLLDKTSVFQNPHIVNV